MATIQTIQIPPNGLAVEVVTLPKNATLIYTSSPGNTDQFQVFLSEDGINYDQFLQVTGPGVYRLPSAIGWMKAAWTPTAQNGITPTLYCAGTFQDDVTSVSSSGSFLPVAPTGGAGPASTFTTFDGSTSWTPVQNLGTPGPWVAGTYNITTVIAVMSATPGVINYWTSDTGTTGATQPVGLNSAAPAGLSPITDGAVSWTYLPAWQPSTVYTNSVSAVYANGVIFSCDLTGTSATTGTGPTGVIWDGTSAWDFIVPVGTLPWLASTSYALNAFISVPARSGGTNYWICTIAGTSASGLLPATLRGVQTLGQTYADGGVTWTAVVAWALNTAYTVSTSYVYANGNVYLCAQSGQSVINPNGPGAYFATDGELPSDFTAIYASGQNGDSLILQGSIDGVNWADLEWDDNQSATFSGISQTRQIESAAVNFLGVLTFKPVSGNFSIVVSENNIVGTADAVDAPSLVATANGISAYGGVSGASLTPTLTQDWNTCEEAAGSGDNALVVNLNDVSGHPLPLTLGLRLTINLTHTLNAGANTLNFNGSGPKSIFSHFNGSANIGTAYTASAAIITVVYNGSGYWLDMSQ